MKNELQKKYGLLTAIAMVVGTVIGSGVFFKAEAVLNATGGNIPMGIAAWVIVGVIMLICSIAFATLAQRYEKVNGLVDYAEVMLGRRYGYYIGWFMATIYTPTLVSVLSWVSARYLCVLLGWDITGGACLVISAFFLVGSYALNILSPRLAGRFQVSTTVIKLIPLLLMAVVGTIAGLTSGTTAANFARTVEVGTGVGGGLLASVVAVAFAYEGWIITISINAELKDSKKNLPRALIIGALIVIVVYVCYYIGLAGAVETPALMESGEAGAKLAFSTIFGSVGGTLLYVFVVISCLGTLNGLTLGCCRGMYSLAARNEGPNPKLFSIVDPVTNIPSNSAVLSLLFSGFWLLYFYGANLSTNWFGPFCFDSSELPIVTLYAMYIPIFFSMLHREKDLSPVRRYVVPILAIIGCLFMVVAAFLAHGMAVVFYLIVFVVVMLIGIPFSHKRS